MSFKKIGPGVFRAPSPAVQLKRADALWLSSATKATPKRRARICAHPRDSEKVHEMLIALARGTYIRPHKHRRKVESYHIVSGRARLISFSDSGRVERAVPLGDYRSGRVFFLRLDGDGFHTILPETDLVMHETTSGPWLKDETRFAPWAPEEGDAAGVAEYLRRLRKESKRS